MSLNINVSEVRTTIGVKDDIVSDTTITEAINIVEENIKQTFNINLEPKKEITLLTANSNDSIYIPKKRTLKLLNLSIGTKEIDLKTVYLDFMSGKLSFKKSAQYRYFSTSNTERIKIKYLNAFYNKNMENITETTSNVLSGDNVSINVESETGFSENEYVLIESLDGSLEVAQITSISSNTLIVDKLINDFETGSLITKMELDKVLKQFALFEISIYISINAVGGSYSFNTGYSKGDLSIQKGVPYPHFEKTVNSLIKQRDTQYQILQSKLISIG